MQFAVPQFTEVEDRLIGPLTLKQFLVLLGTGGLILFFWSVMGPSIIFFALAAPIAIVGIVSAMGKYNGRPMFTYLMPLAAFLSSTRIMVFKREVQSVSVSKSELKKEAKTEQPSPESLEPAESRLKKLAYLLDRKTEEESEIITHDDRNLLTASHPVATPPKIQIGKVLNHTREQIMATARKLDAGSLLHRSSAKPVVKEQPAPLPARLEVPTKPREPEYLPTAQDTIDFTQIEEPEPAPKPAAKPKTKSATSSTARSKKSARPKKFDPSKFLDPNA